ncbi:hypothetical protein Tco_0238116 [Tanacetum coccineum]
MFSLMWITPPRVMTRSAGRPAAESLGGERVNGLVEVEGVEDLGKGCTRLLNDHCPAIAEPLTRHVAQEYDQKLKYTGSSFVGKALTGWNSQIHTRSREIVVGMSWDDFKVLMRKEFCPSNEMQKLETKL